MGTTREDRDDDRPYQIRFGKDGREARSLRSRPEASLAPKLVVVWPSEDRWNDQGYRLLVRFLVETPTYHFEAPYSVAMAIKGFRDTKDGIDSLLQAGVNTPAGTVSGRPPEPAWFVTLHSAIGDYRTLVKELGPKEALRVLEAMHDAVVEKQKSKAASWLAEALSSEAFTVGMLRPSSRYFAYRRGMDILRGNEQEAIERSSANATLRFKLPSFSGAHEVRLNFGKTDIVHRRINVLIGRNGVGKSQTLAHLISALSPGASRRKATIEPRGEFSRVIAFSGIASQTALPRVLGKTSSLQYHYYGLAPARVRPGGTHPLTLALVDLVRGQDQINEARRLLVFEKAIASWMPADQVCVPLREGTIDSRAANGVVAGSGGRYLRMSALHGLSELDELKVIGLVDTTKEPGFLYGDSTICPLSSGQELYFRFALHLCTSIESGTLVLIDEPENHLHPNFITGLMSLLRQILDQTGSFALIASHSPFVVREVTHHDVHIMERDEEGTPNVRQPRLRTLGASVAAVSLYVFGDETIPTLARLTIDGQLAENGVIDNAAVERLAAEFSNEAISHIRSLALSRPGRAAKTDEGA